MRHAIILAGGKGERLRPYTNDCPKPMVPVMGNPLLSYTIKWLVSYGFTHITICCGHLHHVIADYFGDGSRFQAKIQYLVEPEPLGRGGAFRKAMEGLVDVQEPILALNGDIITNLNLHDLILRHTKQNGLVTLVSVPLISPYGIVDIIEENIVSSFREKPELPFWVNAGIYIFEPTVLDLLPEKGDHEEKTFPILAQQGKLKAYKTKAFWRVVDTVKDLTDLRSDCEQLFFGAFLKPMVTI